MIYFYYDDGFYYGIYLDRISFFLDFKDTLLKYNTDAEEHNRRLVMVAYQYFVYYYVLMPSLVFSVNLGVPPFYDYKEFANCESEYNAKGKMLAKKQFISNFQNCLKNFRK